MGPTRELLTQKLVVGANTAMAYVRSRRPTLVLLPPMFGATLAQEDLDGTVLSVEVLVERMHDQLCGPMSSIKEEPED